MMQQQNIASLVFRLRGIFFAGLVLNMITGMLVVVTCYVKQKNDSIQYYRDWLNLLAAIISNVLLIDALRRLNKIVKGVFAVDTWQMICHVAAYTLVLASGILLIFLAYNNREIHAYQIKWFYHIYQFFILTVFLSQLPFCYILHRLIIQSKLTQFESEKSSEVTEIEHNISDSDS